MPGEIRIVELVKAYGQVVAVDGISLEIAAGEFFSLLGPSGCGKTTTLRCTAGFERPQVGRIFLDGCDVTSVAPNRRSVNTVFQSYALFPFLDVANNVAFGLKYARVSKTERRTRVAKALELVRLEGYERRRPAQLSGGQQQRVALARALVLNPAVLLLDEPLGALDAKLRRVLQVELKSLQERVGITFLYVTHDQEEALTMSDRLAVMSEGRIEQVGAPRIVYDEPANAYVADFLGVSNLMSAEVRTPGNGSIPCRLRLGEFELCAERGELGATGAVKLAVRPERVRLHPFDSAGANRLPGMIERVVFTGSANQVIVTLAPGERIQAMITNAAGPFPWRQGTPVTVELPADSIRVLANPRAAAPNEPGLDSGKRPSLASSAR
ncbi:MAG: ABC transporter ATP-binding protein [Solirubrobacteraceae bacterium]